jgi:hypothetical protein
MITSTDPKSNAMLAVLQKQRDDAQEGVALLAGELAAANAKITELRAQIPVTAQDSVPNPDVVRLHEAQS